MVWKLLRVKFLSLLLSCYQTPDTEGREPRSCDRPPAWREPWFTLENLAFSCFLVKDKILLPLNADDIQAMAASIFLPFQPLVLGSETISSFTLSPWGSALAGHAGCRDDWWGPVPLWPHIGSWTLDCKAASCTGVLTFPCMRSWLLLLSF